MVAGAVVQVLAVRACVGMFALQVVILFLLRSVAHTGVPWTNVRPICWNALPVRARLVNYWCVRDALCCPYGQRLETYLCFGVAFRCPYGQNIAMVVNVLAQVILGMFAVLPVRAKLVNHCWLVVALCCPCGQMFEKHM